MSIMRGQRLDEVLEGHGDDMINWFIIRLNK